MMRRYAPLILPLIILMSVSLACNLPAERFAGGEASPQPAENGSPALPTPTPDYLGTVLMESDLPQGFVALSAEDWQALGFDPEAWSRRVIGRFSQAEMQAMSGFIKPDPQGPQAVFSAIFAPLTPLERAGADLVLRNAQRVAGELGSLSDAFDIEVLGSPQAIGDASAALRLTPSTTEQRVPYQAEVVLARRGPTLHLTAVVFLQGTTPEVSVTNLATIVDKRVEGVR